MPVEGGGRADKLGNRYEGLWVARQLLFLLAGELTSVQVEAVGTDEAQVRIPARHLPLFRSGLDGRVARCLDDLLLRSSGSIAARGFPSDT